MSDKKSDTPRFADMLNDVKPIKPSSQISYEQKAAQARHARSEQAKEAKRAAAQQHLHQQSSAAIALSDDYEAHWPEHKPIQFIRDDDSSSAETKSLLKTLKMALYPPDIEVDLHGLTTQQAKREIIAVIQLAVKQHLPCINVIHGHGNGVLKQKVPNYLVQHPDVVGFVQAPKAFGGKAGLLVLVGSDFSRMK